MARRPRQAAPPLQDADARVVFFPVRHHSPAAARLVVELAERRKPQAILIEGPSDFNDRLEELYLGHELPIAIYSYLELADGQRRAAYHPFCVYSPEWQALQVGRRVGASVRFIDLPWSATARSDSPAHCYSDHELLRGHAVSRLCDEFGVDDFHALWDRLFEIDPELSVEDYMRRAHELCASLREVDPAGERDRRREAFMGEEIERATRELTGPILVVTGGYHSPALHARLHGLPYEVEAPATEPDAAEPPEPVSEGIALTAYSYQRLDSLTGYDAGMPNPGFYHRAFHQEDEAELHVELLANVARDLRKRGQVASTADLIAVDTAARALARLRGHARVWRVDLVDAITTALVKDEMAHGVANPFLDAIHEVFRGHERGILAEGTELPPIVGDIRRELARHELTPDSSRRELTLSLPDPEARERSRVLHRLQLAGIAGYRLIEGCDLVGRDDLSDPRETWALLWTPDHEATCIEAARYGGTLTEAAAAVLAEEAEGAPRHAGDAAARVVRAVQAGLTKAGHELRDTLREAILDDSELTNLGIAVGHLLYLYRHDSILGVARDADLGELLVAAWSRAVEALAGIGRAAAPDDDLIRAVSSILTTIQSCGDELALSRAAVIDALELTAADSTQRPALRGAAVGSLYRLGAADDERVLSSFAGASLPAHLGDFLHGLLSLARELVQRDANLLGALDAQLADYDQEEFFEALPALRLAFASFTPRERHYLAESVAGVLGLDAGSAEAAALATRFEVTPVEAEAAMRFEGRLLELASSLCLAAAPAESKGGA